MAEEPRTPEPKAAELDPDVKPSEQKADITPPDPDEAEQDALEQDRFDATDN